MVALILIDLKNFSLRENNVAVDLKFSNMERVPSGDPQGSVLGLLLFILFLLTISLKIKLFPMLIGRLEYFVSVIKLSVGARLLLNLFFPKSYLAWSTVLRYGYQWPVLTSTYLDLLWMK